MYESFSQEVKNEICAFKTKHKCCRGALLSGMITGSNSFAPELVELESENPFVVMSYIKLIREFTGLKRDSDISLTRLEGAARVNTLLAGLNTSDPLSYEFQCEECRKAFVRGAFLTCGTISYPESSYHMEFLLKGKERVELLSTLLSELGAVPKVTERRNGFYGLYYKDSENVVDILGHLGANRAAFKLLDVKIFKDLRNIANRIANCETANISKTVAASDAQMRAIERIIESGKTDELPDELRQTLDLRAAFPGATLSELAEMHTPPITKSGVNHRLKRIVDFSIKLYNENNTEEQ